MSNEKKTAMQQLISELKSSNTILSNLIAMGLCEKYLAIEKQQIVEAFIEGYNSGENKALGIPEKSRKQFEDGEQYYSQTYSNHE